MKVILIDPNVPIVDEVELEPNSLPAIRKLLGCNHIEAIRFPGADDWIILDEEGKLRTVREKMWVVRGFPDVLVGRGLVVGVNEEGDEVTPAMGLLLNMEADERAELINRVVRKALRLPADELKNLREYQETHLYECLSHLEKQRVNERIRQLEQGAKKGRRWSARNKQNR